MFHATEAIKRLALSLPLLFLFASSFWRQCLLFAFAGSILLSITLSLSKAAARPMPFLLKLCDALFASSVAAADPVDSTVVMLQDHVSASWGVYQNKRQTEQSTQRLMQSTNKETPLPTMPDALRSKLEPLVMHTMRDFVFSWYSPLSSDPALPLLLETYLYQLCARLRSMLQRPDWDRRVMNDLIPTVILHMRRFKIADLIVRGEGDTPRYSGDWESRIIQYYQPQTYGLDAAHAKDSIEQKMLRLLDRIFASVSHLVDAENTSDLTSKMVQEICTSTIVAPLFHYLASTEFANQQLLYLVPLCVLRNRPSSRALIKTD